VKRLHCIFCYIISLSLCYSTVNINAKDSHGWNALHCAAFWGKLESVKLLVSLGADLTPKTNGKTAIELADSRSENEVVSFLKKLEQK
jgi:ankyrin repeat protein